MKAEEDRGGVDDKWVERKQSPIRFYSKDLNPLDSAPSFIKRG